MANPLNLAALIFVLSKGCRLREYTATIGWWEKGFFPQPSLPSTPVSQELYKNPIFFCATHIKCKPLSQSEMAVWQQQMWRSRDGRVTFPSCVEGRGSSSSPLGTLHCHDTARPANHHREMKTAVVHLWIDLPPITYYSTLHVISLLMMDKLSNAEADLNHHPCVNF